MQILLEKHHDQNYNHKFNTGHLFGKLSYCLKTEPVYIMLNMAKILYIFSYTCKQYNPGLWNSASITLSSECWLDDNKILQKEIKKYI